MAVRPARRNEVAQDALLAQPLLNLRPEPGAIAIQINRVLCKFVHEHTLTDVYQLRLVNHLVRLVDGKAQLRDEATLQTMRMTYGNSRPTVAARAWLLLGVLVALFTPTKWLFGTLLNYIILEGAPGADRPYESDPPSDGCTGQTRLPLTLAAVGAARIRMHRLLTAPDQVGPVWQQRFWRARAVGSRSSPLTSLELQSLLVRDGRHARAGLARPSGRPS